MSGSGYPPPPPLQYAPIPAERSMPLANAHTGGIRLFRIAGISVYAHWSWLIFAVYGVQSRAGHYSSFGWNVADFSAWVIIVMLHEFGHAFACRSVGGSVERLVLLPLGGAAYTNPPPRPGPTLWTIAGGPLVNALLVPILFGAHSVIVSIVPSPDVNSLLWIVKWLNVILLIIQLLPFYPLDGGQILQCILWFFMDRSRSIMISASIGIVGASGWAAYAVYEQSIWMGLFAGFAVIQCITAFQRARQLNAKKDIPRRWDFACPACRTSPPLGAHVQCKCGAIMDPFATQCTCPRCRNFEVLIPCQHCGRAIRSYEWTRLPWPTAVPMPAGYQQPAAPV